MQQGTLEAGKYVEVAVLDAPLPGLTYRLTGDDDRVVDGARVLVPLSGRPALGVVLGPAAAPDADMIRKIRDVGEVLDDEPVLSARQLDLVRWMARYYHSPPGDVIKLALPAALRGPGQRRIGLTEAGARALEAGVVDALAQAGLSALVAGEASVKALRDEVPGLTYRAVDRWEKAGWVESDWVASLRVQVKIEKWVWLVRDPFDGERLGPKQEQILLRLQGLGTGEAVRLDDLKAEVPSPLPSLRSLEQRSIVAIEEREVYRDPFRDAGAREKATDHELTPDQAAACGAILGQLDEAVFRAFLLHGVTGSGKTEVYVRAVREALVRGRTALILLPEISLTPQFVGVFRAHFGERIAVLHSGLSDGERFDEWRRIRRGEAGIVIGARSALFAPLSNIGVVVVDEEHDGSFKQESGCRYNARDVAQYLGRQQGAVVLLGSATPAMETYFNAMSGRVGYLPMSSRVAERAMPAVQILDVRGTAEGGGVDDSGVSSMLLRELRATVAAGDQAILFLNRRGFSPCMTCRDCGHVWRCPNCSVSLTWHQRPGRLRCHYCDHVAPGPDRCPTCSSVDVGRVGVGTERLEGALAEALDARVARLDRDTGYGSRLEALLRKFRRREIDVLVGTQMVTKGHDFPNVTLVGVVLADLGLNFPDFRAAERTFQLLTQVAGRAGRGQRAGRVIVQTYSPDHYALLAASKHSYARFVDSEIQLRRDLGYPPFGYLVAVHFDGPAERDVSDAARAWGRALTQRVAGHAAWRESVTVLGPAQAPLGRIRNKSRWQLLLKSPSRSALHDLVRAVEAAPPKTPRVRVTVDVDPQSMM